MRYLTILLIGLLFSKSVYSQESNSDYLKSVLKPGFPKGMDIVVKETRIKILNSGLLETGLDSVCIYFGENIQCNKKGYWLSVFLYDSLLIYSGIYMEENDSDSIIPKDINLRCRNISKQITLRISHNSIANEVYYIWLNKGVPCKKLEFQNYEYERTIEKNKQFPNLKFETLKGDTITSEDFYGKIIVLNWWYTKCGPCILEIFGLNKLVDKYGSNPDILFLAIALDKKDKLEHFLKEKKFKYYHVLGNKEVAEILGQEFPTNIIIDSKGIITFYKIGGNVDTYKDIDSEIESILSTNAE